MPEPDTDGRELPPEAVRNLKRRYGRIRWLGYFALLFAVLDWVRGEGIVDADSPRRHMLMIDLLPRLPKS